MSLEGFYVNLEKLSLVSPSRFYPILEKTQLNPKDWVSSRQLASIKKGLATYLEGAKDNSPFIKIEGLGFLPVPVEVVVQLSQPGVVLGTGFGIMASHDAYRKVGELYGLKLESYPKITWVGSAAEAKKVISNASLK